MTKTVLWIVGAVVVISGVVLLRGNPGDMTQEPLKDDASDLMIADAFNGSGSIKCVHQSSDDVSGIIYAKNGKIRGETVTTVGTQNWLFLGDKIYNWGVANDVPYGIVMMVSADVTSEDGSSISKAELQSNLVGTGTSCEDYDTPDSMFAVPTNIKFTTMEEIQKGMVPAGY